MYLESLISKQFELVTEMYKVNVTKGFEITYNVILILAEGFSLAVKLLTNFKRRNSKSYGLIKIYSAFVLTNLSVMEL